MTMPTFAYLASIDVADPANGLSTVQLFTSGHSAISVNLFSALSSVVPGDSPAIVTVYNHTERGLGFVVGEDREASAWMSLTHSINSLGDALHDNLRSQASSASWSSSSSITFHFDEVALTYTISYSLDFSVTFGNAATARLFGFTDLVLAGESTYTSTITPWLVIRPVLSAVSSPTPNYEPEAIAVQAVSNSGAVSGLARSISPIYRDWVQQYETKEKTIRMSATTSEPFTHQDLFENCRTILPFVVLNGFAENEDHSKEVFYLRSEGSFWKPERASDSNDAQFHITYKTLVAGYIVPFEGG